MTKIGKLSIVACDPGRLTGLATIHGLLPNGSLLLVDHYTTAKSWTEIESYLLSKSDSVDAVVCEDFEAFQGKRAINQDRYMIQTIKYIGRIQQWCKERKILFVPSSPTNKSTGYELSPFKKTTVKDDSHWRDAVAHGAHFINLQQGRTNGSDGTLWVLPYSQSRSPQSNHSKQQPRRGISRYK